MTVNESLSLAGAVVTTLGMVGGGAWWMASLHALVRNLAAIAAEMREEVKALRHEMHGAHDQLWEVVREHEHRLDKLEAKQDR